MTPADLDQLGREVERLWPFPDITKADALSLIAELRAARPALVEAHRVVAMFGKSDALPRLRELLAAYHEAVTPRGEE